MGNINIVIIAKNQNQILLRFGPLNSPGGRGYTPAMVSHSMNHWKKYREGDLKERM